MCRLVVVDVEINGRILKDQRPIEIAAAGGGFCFETLINPEVSKASPHGLMEPLGPTKVVVKLTGESARLLVHTLPALSSS